MPHNVSMSFSRQSVHQNVFFLLLATLVVAMPTSKFLMSAAMIFLSANWLIEGRFRQKWQMAKSNWVLTAFVALYAIHIIWCLFSSNWSYAIDDLQKKLPLLAIPVVVLTSDFLDRKKTGILFFFYCTTVAVASIYGIVRYFCTPDIGYRNIFPHFSHIRFSINVCMALILTLYSFHKTLNNKELPCRKTTMAVLVVFMALYAAILLLLQSYTAFAILAVVFVVLMGATAFRKRKNKIYPIAFVALIAMAIGGAWLCFRHYHAEYYQLKKLSYKPLAAKTAQGNPYTHANDGLVEMGNYINNYVCDEELRSQWAKRSPLHIDSATTNGYAVYPTLVRYLNAKGLTKDSTGVWQLSTTDLHLIEQGVANPHYASKLGTGKLFYRMFFEFDQYRRYGVVLNSSLLQRIELWRNGWAVFLNHPVLGVGTGDVADEVALSLKQRHSQLADKGLRTHNQYITLLLTFGIVGFVAIAFVFGMAIRRGKLLGSAVFVAYLCIVLVSFVSEDTLETEAGVVFVSLMFALLSQWVAARAKQ